MMFLFPAARQASSGSSAGYAPSAWAGTTPEVPGIWDRAGFGAQAAQNRGLFPAHAATPFPAQVSGLLLRIPWFSNGSPMMLPENFAENRADYSSETSFGSLSRPRSVRLHEAESFS